MKKPLYEIGQEVTFVDKYHRTHKGEIINIEKTYKEVESDGSFMEGGLVTLESTISSIALPYQFDGEALKVEFPESKYGDYVQMAYMKESRFYGYSYTIKTSMNDMPDGVVRMVVGEKQIKN